MLGIAKYTSYLFGFLSRTIELRLLPLNAVLIGAVNFFKFRRADGQLVWVGLLLKFLGQVGP